MSLKREFKTAIAYGWDLTRTLRSRRPQLTILYYHAVPAAYAQAFDDQMAYLARTANVVHPDHTGPLDDERPNVAVTFDDAFRSVREHALPALARHGIPATVFVPTGWLGRRPGWAMETSGDAEEIVMDADELAALPRDLVRLGSHTVDHPRLSQIPPAERARQFRESRATLEALSGGPVDTLAFPYGDHDMTVVEEAGKAGYRFVYTVAPEAIRQGATAKSRGRTSVDPSESVAVFALKTRGGFDWMPIASRIKAAVIPRR